MFIACETQAVLHSARSAILVGELVGTPMALLADRETCGPTKARSERFRKALVVYSARIDKFFEPDP